MAKKIEKEENEIVEEFFRQNDSKNIKSMNDMYSAWREFFAPAFQKLLDAEMETKLGYSKNERTVSTEMGDIPVKVPRDRNEEIESDLVPKNLLYNVFVTLSYIMHYIRDFLYIQY
ncbi:MAG TPA: hypothetical protein DEP51_02710 [Clostridiales bacterium]|nr:hypothetical protein [Clostridiales bacterium]